MDNQEAQFKEPGEEIQESIQEREEIIAPENFVSIYHETKTENLPFINRDGLTINTENKNIGKAEVMARRNRMIDKLRPEALKEQGISRESNIFAYPFLEEGHGLIGADQRFIKRDEKMLRDQFETFRTYSPNYLRKLGTSTPEEFIKKMTDPEYLRREYPGEVLQIKVDPKKCYVGDVEYITRIMDDIHRGFTESQAVQLEGEIYWICMVTLEDFLKWYRKPKGAYSYTLLKDAPNNLPSEFILPEILIPENVPQNHIKLVK